jgi:hypothetical protein
MYTRAKAIATAATPARAASRRETNTSPTATAPAITAWSEGNEKSALRVASTSTPGWSVYGRASCTAVTIGWLIPTASRVAAPAQTTAAIRCGSPMRRADHHPAPRSRANTTTP